MTETHFIYLMTALCVALVGVQVLIRWGVM